MIRRVHALSLVSLSLTSVSPDAIGTDSTRTFVPPSASTTTSFLPSPSKSVTSGKGTGRVVSSLGRGRSPTILQRRRRRREVGEGVGGERRKRQTVDAT